MKTFDSVFSADSTLMSSVKRG